MKANIIPRGIISTELSLKKTQSEVSVISFDVDVQPYHTSAHDMPKPFLLHCLAWRGVAEFLYKFFRQGQMVEIIGDYYLTDSQGEQELCDYAVVEKANFLGEDSSRQAKIVIEPHKFPSGSSLAQEMENAPDEYWVPDEDSPF